MTLLSTRTPSIRDLKIGEYKVVVVDAELGTSQDLSQLCSSIQWDYDLDQPPEHYQISFVHTENIARRVKPGDRIKVYGWAVRPLGSTIEMYWELLKRVYIATTTISSGSGGELKATGYNVLWFLMKNKDTVILQNETATQFITRTAQHYGIPLGTVMDTGVMLEREPFMNRTIWDMWVTCLSYTRDIDPNAKFLLQEKNGKVELVAHYPPGAIWEFNRGRFEPGPLSWANNPGNIFSSDNTFSMDDYINVIRVYKGGQTTSASQDPLGSGAGSSDVPLEGGSGDPSIIYQYPSQADIEAGNVGEINRYGMFSDSVDLQMPGETSLDLGSEAANAQEQAMKIYKKRNKIQNTGTITTFNINTMQAGNPVHVRDNITGLVGKYYVKSGSHTVTDQESSMTLTVNIEDALPEAYAAQHQTLRAASKDVFGSGTATTTTRGTTPVAGVPDPWTSTQLVTAGFTVGDGPALAGDTHA